MKVILLCRCQTNSCPQSGAEMNEISCTCFHGLRKTSKSRHRTHVKSFLTTLRPCKVYKTAVWFHTSSIQVQDEWVTSLLVVSTVRYPESLCWSLTIAHKRMSMKTNNDEWGCCPVSSVVVAIYGSLLMSRVFYTIFGCLSWYCYRISIYKLHIMLYSPQINYIFPLI